MNKQQQFHTEPSIESGFDEQGHYKIIPLSMVKGGVLKPTKVYTKPAKHILNQSNPTPRGWYKNKHEPKNRRPRPCLLPDVAVNTPLFGDVEIQHLSIGDIIFGYDECTGSVVHAYVQGVACQIKGEYLEVELDNGNVLKLTPEHLVYVKVRGWVETKTLRVQDDIIDIGLRYNSGKTRSLCGIYGIVNTVDNKMYVGSAVNIVSRLKRHKKKLDTGNHSNLHLQAAYDRGDEFRLIILEVCAADMLIRREQYYMDLHNSLNTAYGYNMTEAGRTVPTEAGRRRIGEIRKGKTWEAILGQERAERFRAILRGQTGYNNPNYGNAGILNPRYGKSNIELFGEEEATRLASITTQALTGRSFSEIHKRNISKSREGMKLSELTKKKIGEASKAWWANNKGIVRRSEETKERIRQTLLMKYANGELPITEAQQLARKNNAKLLNEGRL